MVAPFLGNYNVVPQVPVSQEQMLGSKAWNLHYRLPLLLLLSVQASPPREWELENLGFLLEIREVLYHLRASDQFAWAPNDVVHCFRRVLEPFSLVHLEKDKRHEQQTSGYGYILPRTPFWFSSLAAEKPQQKMAYDYVGGDSAQLAKPIV